MMYKNNLFASFLLLILSLSVTTVNAGSLGLKITDSILGVAVSNQTPNGQNIEFEGFGDQATNNYAASFGLRTQAYANQPRASGVGLAIKLFGVYLDDYNETATGISLGVDYTYFLHTTAPVFVRGGVSYSPKVLLSNATSVTDTSFILGYEVLPSSIVSLEFRSIRASLEEVNTDVISSALIGIIISF